MYSKHIILNTYSKSICEVKNTTVTKARPTCTWPVTNQWCHTSVWSSWHWSNKVVICPYQGQTCSYNDDRKEDLNLGELGPGFGFGLWVTIAGPISGYEQRKWDYWQNTKGEISAAWQLRRTDQQKGVCNADVELNWLCGLDPSSIVSGKPNCLLRQHCFFRKTIFYRDPCC